MLNSLTTRSHPTRLSPRTPSPTTTAAAGLAAAVGIAGLLTVAASPAQAQTQIVLAPTSVIGGTASYSASSFDGGQFAAGYIFDNQSAVTIDESDQTAGDANGLFWLGQENVYNSNVVVDLGAQYSLDSISIYNTHNAGYNDRGTNGFEIYGSNSVTAGTGSETGLDLVTPTLLLTGNLVYQTNDGNPSVGELTAQSFSFAAGSNYEYIRINTTSAYPTGSSVGVGLNEVKVYSGAAAPEPASLAFLVPASLPLLGMAGCRRRRRTRGEA